MPTPTSFDAGRVPAARTGSVDDPLRLWDQVVRARAVVERERRVPVNGSCASARSELLAALEAYVASLATHARPVPYALRDELRLQRLTSSADRQLRYDPQPRRGLR